MNAEDCFNHLWFISDPLVRSESGEFEKEDNSNEIKKDGDDPIVESFFIGNDDEWTLKWFFIFTASCTVG